MLVKWASSPAGWLSDRLTVWPAYPTGPDPVSRVSVTVNVCGTPRSFVADGGLMVRLYALYCFVPDPVRVNVPEARVVLNVAVSVTSPGFDATIVTEHGPSALVTHDPVVPLAATPLMFVKCASSPAGCVSVSVRV